MPDDTSPRVVLAVYAHPDDAEVACGGSLLAWSRTGASTHLLVLTSGDKGTSDPAVEPRDLVARRQSESHRAAAALGLAARETLGIADGEVANDAGLRRELVSRVRSLRPDMVLTHDPTASFFGSGYVNHRDHREAGWAVLDACAPAASSPLYFPDTGAAHRVREILLSGTLEPDHWVDIDAALDDKVRAVRCHESQLGDDLEVVGDVVRRRAADEGRRSGLTHAESFRRLTL